MKTWLTVAEGAAYAGVSRDTIYTVSAHLKPRKSGLWSPGLLTMSFWSQRSSKSRAGARRPSRSHACSGAAAAERPLEITDSCW